MRQRPGTPRGPSGPRLWVGRKPCSSCGVGGGRERRRRRQKEESAELLVAAVARRRAPPRCCVDAVEARGGAERRAGESAHLPLRRMVQPPDRVVQQDPQLVPVAGERRRRSDYFELRSQWRGTWAPGRGPARCVPAAARWRRRRAPSGADGVHQRRINDGSVGEELPAPEPAELHGHCAGGGGGGV